jgi:hypothetical protein
VFIHGSVFSAKLSVLCISALRYGANRHYSSCPTSLARKMSPSLTVPLVGS